MWVGERRTVVRIQASEVVRGVGVGGWEEEGCCQDTGW